MEDDTCNVLQLNEQWYISLIDECKDIITETEFTSRWALIEGYHALGSRILSDNRNFERVRVYGQDIVQHVAESLNKKPRTIYYAIQFAKEYPALDLLPEGKNTSWHHIVNKYLTNGTDKKVVKKADLYKMIKEIKELLETELKKELQLVNNGEIAVNKSNVEFIRYLQDQVNKITGVLNG